MKTMLIILVMVTLQNMAKASTLDTITRVEDIAQSFDNLYADTVSEGDVNSIDTFKAYTVITSGFNDEIVSITLVNDYTDADDKASTFEATATVEENNYINIESVIDLNTKKDV